MSNDKQDVFETILAQEEATLERWFKGNPLAYAERMAEEITYFTVGIDGRLDGKSAVEALIAPLEGQTNAPAFEILKPELQLGEDIGIFTFNLNELDQDSAVVVRYNATEIYRQMGSEWRMIHAHWSIIGETE